MSAPRKLIVLLVLKMTEADVPLAEARLAQRPCPDAVVDRGNRAGEVLVCILREAKSLRSAASAAVADVLEIFPEASVLRGWSQMGADGVCKTLVIGSLGQTPVGDKFH